MAAKQSTPALGMRFCQTTLFARLTSQLTSRVIIENQCPTRFLIAPSWSQEKAKDGVRRWLSSEPVEKLNGPRFVDYFKSTATDLLGAATREEFAVALDKALALVSDPQSFRSGSPRVRLCVVELLAELWTTECVIWPTGESPLGRLLVYWAERQWGSAQPLISLIRSSLDGGCKEGAEKAMRPFIRFLMTRSLVADIGDVRPPSIPLVLKKGDHSGFGLAARVVVSLQRSAYPTQAQYDPKQFARSAAAAAVRNEPELRWALGSGERLALWQDDAREFVATVKKDRALTLTGVNAWLRLVIERPEIPSNPVELFKWPRQEQERLAAELRHQTQPLSLRVMRDLLEFSLGRNCGCADDFDKIAIAPGFHNPLRGETIARPKAPAQTHREPMPLRFITLCQKILTEDDFAWPKKVGRAACGGDWFKFRDPKTGASETMWSPVRCFALLAKLMLPARTIQIRMLDSGEADSEFYDPAAQRWSPNEGALAPGASAGGRRAAQRGVFRKYQRKDRSVGSLIFFNTNKTADIDSRAAERGYVMPWEHAEALRLFAELRDWQRKYNPLAREAAWADVPEYRLRDKDELARWGTACFLFRDPTIIANPTLPITTGRLGALWKLLMEELERRLLESGERLPNGEPIRLMTRENRKADTPIFDLHSLRVTMITALYEQGVPPEFIMRVAGHASILMTLYYVKISGDEVSRAITQAHERRQQDEQAEWIGYLQGKSDGDLKRVTARAHDSAVHAFANSQKTGLAVMDHGFCPMSAQRCGDGLVISEEATAINKYQAVPGGPENCVRCRFFITGPAFLGGLEAYFNDLAFKAQSASRGYESAQARYEETLDLDARSGRTAGTPIGSRQLSAAQGAYEKAAARIDSILLAMHATYRLVEQCVDIANREPSPNGEGFSLLLPANGQGRLETMLRESTAFDQLNRICDAASVYEGLSQDSQLASVQRMRCFDRMLSERGMAPVFCLIENEELAVKVANEMARFITAGLAARPASGAKGGRASLASLGFEQAFPIAFNEAKARAEKATMAALPAPRRIIPIISLDKRSQE